MEIVFSSKALDEFQYWKSSGNVKVLSKIKALIDDIQQTPFHGIGKPEALKHNMSGYWSRRITGEHRLVYKVKEMKY